MSSVPGREAPAVTPLEWRAGASPERLNLPALLALHAVVWALAAWLSRGNLDPSGDMAENYVWGIEWQAGYAKHPPLFAWVTAAWFSVMPRADGAYFLLSALNAGVGLLGVAALARRFVAAETAAIAALALAVSPLYTSLAIKFNANAMLLSVWPWAALHFVAFAQSGRLRHAAACGGLVALALLGKYFSAVLGLAFVLALVAVPAWRSRLRGAGPWVALAACVLLLAPHIMWLVDQQFATLRYASQRSEGSFVPALLRLLNYSAAQFAYLLPPALFVIFAVQAGQRRAALALLARSTLRPALQRELWWLAFAPMLVIAAIAVLARTPMASVWGMAQWFGVTTLWLAVLGQQGIVPRGRWLRRALPVYWAGVLLIATAVGYADARRGEATAIEPRAELARATHALWRERTGRELRIVGGAGADAMSIAFYAPGKTRWWNPFHPELTPWLHLADWQREGGVIVCADDDHACQQAAPRFAAAAPLRVTVHKQAWGFGLPARSYRLYFSEKSSVD